MASGTAVSFSLLYEATAAVYQSISALNQKYVQDESPDSVYGEGIRKHFIFQDGLIMMNNGTVGPMPRPAFNTLMKYFRLQMTNPFDVYNFIPTLKQEVRQKLANFVHASVE